MRALVTGSAGFVGQHMTRILTGDGLTVNGFDLFSGNDVRDYEQVRQVIDRFEPDLVFHLAAVSWPRESLTDPRRSFDVNVTGAVNILEAVRNVGSHARIMLAGTSEEYGYEGRAGEFLTEDSACRPASPYGVSKLAAGLLGMVYARRYDMPVVAMRAFNHSGAGRQACNAESAFARRIVAVERGQADKVLHGDLSSVRNFSNVRDVIAAYREAIWQEPGIWNVCGNDDGTVTMRQMMDMLTEMATVPVLLEQDFRLGGPAERGFPVPVHDKLTKACGWEPRVPLEETLSEVLDYWRSR